MSDPVIEAAVIIPHYNDSARLARCLAALAESPAAVLARVEICVADNGSSEDLSPIMAAHPAIRFVSEPEKGAAAARNRGVRETSAPRLIFLDADCRPLPGWLARALEVDIRGDTFVGGRVDTFDETPAPRSGAEAFETVFAFHQRVYVEEKGFSVTANLVTSRAHFEKVGPFIVGLSEDIEWCERAGRMGARAIYDDALAVEHPTRQDWAALRKKWQRLNSELFGLMPQGPRGRVKWGVRAVAVASSALLDAPRLFSDPRLDGMGERLRAFLTLVRLRSLRSFWMLGQVIGGR